MSSIQVEKKLLGSGRTHHPANTRAMPSRNEKSKGMKSMGIGDLFTATMRLQGYGGSYL